MMTITIIYVGGEKEIFFKEAAAEYKKRLMKDCKLKEISLKEEKLSRNPTQAEIKSGIEKEAEKILLSIPERGYIIGLCIEGKEFSSEEFSSMIESVPKQGFSNCVFIVGSSAGLSDKIKDKCHIKLSLSKMTFAHKLARVMLLEQIYRAFSISNKGKYHK